MRAGALLGLTAVAVLGSGCDDYLDRRDTVTLGVGDSVAINRATQTINRWPAAARRDRWLSDGEQARIAQSRYRRRAVPNPKSLDSGSGSLEAEPADQGGGATQGK
ncbi:MAG: hypothetical protein ABL907_03325 [Hyphomicrobium sp.]